MPTTFQDSFHWHRPPAPATVKLVDGAPLDPTDRGLRAVIESIAYPDGHVQIAVSRVQGAPRARTIVQTGSLMFNNVDEAKDAVDLLLDRLDLEAELSVSEEGRNDVTAIDRYLQEQLHLRGTSEVTAVEAARWLDHAQILRDSPQRPGLPLRAR